MPNEIDTLKSIVALGIKYFPFMLLIHKPLLASSENKNDYFQNMKQGENENHKKYFELL